jgi:ADP-ribosyl-[dinitrogen reductase] hydrolase
MIAAMMPRAPDPAAPFLIDFVDVRSTGARIGIAPCPGTRAFPSTREAWEMDLAADLDAIAAWGAAAVVTLMRTREVRTPPLVELRRGIEARTMAWYHLPVHDGSVPDDRFEAAWREAGGRLRQILGEGRSVLLHCRAGLGRSGMIAARLLVELGENPRVAMERVRGARPGAIETSAQERYVLALRLGPRTT